VLSLILASSGNASLGSATKIASCARGTTIGATLLGTTGDHPMVKIHDSDDHLAVR
jgi:hypothetical protein